MILFENCKCKLDTRTINLFGVSRTCLSHSKSGWLCQGCRRQGNASSLTGTDELATYRIDAVKESREQFFRRTVSQLLARPCVQFIGRGQNVVC